ncbi:MAG: chorismate-binding protein [Thiotrichaceae bacterium]|nr:chorismate-binding protein [Thiotrichaceae bacterium]
MISNKHPIVTTSIPWACYQTPQILSAMLTTATLSDASIAFWSEPDDEQLHIIIHFGEIKRYPVSAQMPKGFCFSPFHASGKACLLTADLLFLINKKGLSDNNKLTTPEQKSFIALLKKTLLQPIKTCYYCAKEQALSLGEEKSTFLSLVKKGLSAIEQGAIDKVVLAHQKTISLNNDYDPIAFFLRLQHTCPQHFVSILSTQEYGCWIGCSPELLLSVESEIIETVSLAGTKLKEDQWSAKEYQEQAYVNDFIRQQFNQLGIEDIQETVLSHVNIGQYDHLKTIFNINLKNKALSRSIIEPLLNNLQPTPAVCGVPKQEAMHFILENEGFERQLYCGYLGPCHLKPEQIKLYMNIRCMQLFDHTAILYVGAGITKDSKPLDEWEEINLKSQTLLSLLKD